MKDRSVLQGDEIAFRVRSARTADSTGGYRFLMLRLFSSLLTYWTALIAGQLDEPDWGPVARELRDGLLTALMLTIAEARVEALKQRQRIEAQKNK